MPKKSYVRFPPTKKEREKENENAIFRGGKEERFGVCVDARLSKVHTNAYLHVWEILTENSKKKIQMSQRREQENGDDGGVYIRRSFYMLGEIDS